MLYIRTCVPLLRVISETVSAFSIFLTNPVISVHRKHILLELQFQLMIYVQLYYVLLFENPPRQNVYVLCSTCEWMFCGIVLACQSVKVLEIQWNGCFMSNVEEQEGYFLPKYCTNTRRLISAHLVKYASSLVIPTKELKAPFQHHLEQLTQNSDVKFITKILTYYKN